MVQSCKFCLNEKARMIPRTQTYQQPQDWQSLLAEGISSSSQLLELLDLPQHLLSNDAEQQFATRIPLSFIAKMRKGDVNDPLLLQVLASPLEMQTHVDYSVDPVGEQQCNPVPGLLHKYHGRVLLTVTGACAINCRYCFRRHFPYQDNNPGSLGWLQAIEYIAADPSITEVILSGGDPLLANDKTLQRLIAALADIKHLRRLRIHSRIPIVLPERMTPQLLKLLQLDDLSVVLVTHCNHANEIDTAVIDALQRCATNNIQLLNQSVLLHNVNNDEDVLCDLSEALFAAGVLPYYLHMLDKVQGAMHFDVSEKHARDLIKMMMQRLPGYLVPKLVIENSGADSKTPIDLLENS